MGDGYTAMRRWVKPLESEGCRSGIGYKNNDLVKEIPQI